MLARKSLKIVILCTNPMENLKGGWSSPPGYSSSEIAWAICLQLLVLIYYCVESLYFYHLFICYMNEKLTSINFNNMHIIYIVHVHVDCI